MRHDVLCAKYGFEDDPGQDVWGYEPPVRACDCARFPGVRKDERLRVRGLIQAEIDSICSRRPTPDAAALDGLDWGLQIIDEDDHVAAVAEAEQRGREAEFDGGWYDKGFADALGKARHAMIRLHGNVDHLCCDEYEHAALLRALAAIDALRTPDE